VGAAAIGLSIAHGAQAAPMPGRGVSLSSGASTTLGRATLEIHRGGASHMSWPNLRRGAAAAWCLAAVAISPVAAQPSAVETGTLRIATGGSGGIYHLLGEAICRSFNRAAERHGMRCTSQSTAGSVANLAALRAGRAAIAILQSDAQAQAFSAAGGGFADMRALFSAHAEALTLVARRDERIAGLADLAGKRVARGEVGSGVRDTARVAMAAAGLPERRLGQSLGLSPAVGVSALCAFRIDAFIYVVGHPAAVIEDAMRCGGGLVAIDGEGIRTLIARQPEYILTIIPGGLYEGQPADVPTIGTLATVVTTARLSDRVATEIMRAVFDDLAAFRQVHRALATLRPEDMAARGNTAPLHPAAVAYFRQRGWLR
jgi:TRAP transporter TAXI family solute receptor